MGSAEPVQKATSAFKALLLKRRSVLKVQTQESLSPEAGARHCLAVSPLKGPKTKVVAPLAALAPSVNSESGPSTTAESNVVSAVAGEVGWLKRMVESRLDRLERQQTRQYSELVRLITSTRLPDSGATVATVRNSR